MSKFDDNMELYKAQNSDLGLGLSEDLIKAVAKGLGPAIYNADSSLVSGADQKEKDTVKNNFLIKKLGLQDGPALDAAIEEAIAKMGSSNKNKYRANFYALLVKKFGKESVYA